MLSRSMLIHCQDVLNVITVRCTLSAYVWYVKNQIQKRSSKISVILQTDLWRLNQHSVECNYAFPTGERSKLRELYWTH